MLDLGVSPRARWRCFRAAQALALSEERSYCIPDDIKRLVIPTFAIAYSSAHGSLHQCAAVKKRRLSCAKIMKTVSVPL